MDPITVYPDEYKIPNEVAESCNVAPENQSEECKESWENADRQCWDLLSYMWTETCDAMLTWHEDYYWLWNETDWSTDVNAVSAVLAARRQSSGETKDRRSFGYEFAIGASIGALGAAATYLMISKKCAGK